MNSADPGIPRVSVVEPTDKTGPFFGAGIQLDAPGRENCYHPAHVRPSSRSNAGQPSLNPAREATRRAEFRLVSFVAMRRAATPSPLTAAAWREQRRGQLSGAWPAPFGVAGRGRAVDRAARLAKFGRRAPSRVALRGSEKQRAQRHIWNDNRRLVDRPLIRAR